MRPARDRESAPAAVSHTPIYDTLYSEYLRAFRALPGDRTGEEDLGFTAFWYAGGGSYPGGGTAYGSGTGGSGYAGGSYGSGWNGSAWQTDPWPATYAPAPQPSYAYAGSATGGADHAATGSAYAGGRQHHTGMQHIPAALPPAPRRGY
ncbi:hypothetical protein [Streptomyces sp. NRRL S-244]|uniref:hypothetical protein n=1 Tax=Streptomyces sp. NRRL S-244 TaxID=1463897 RepID=UPI000AA9EFFF|nr:hypothetical protein [Streptomyces sp. NRRL S-244]